MTQTAEASFVDTVTDWLARLDAALGAEDAEAAAALFADECYWRDLVAFTWNITTVEGREQIVRMLRATLPTTAPSGWRITPGEQPSSADGVIEAWIEFETATGRGSGHVRLRDGRAWTLLTSLTELTGFEEPSGARRRMGTEHGAFPDRVTWAERRQREAEVLGRCTQPYVLVVGGGQGGITLGARLRQLDVPTIVIDKHARPGDQWRGRYKSLCLHDPVWYDHLPYLPFPANWPVFSPKDKIADWLEFYTSAMEINYWGGTEAVSASYDEDRGEWTVTVRRDGTELVLHPKQLVLATGMSGVPNVPELPGQDIFRGEAHHSSAHPGPDRYRGKRCVVVGSNNSAFDICGALWEQGADVTMVQRSSTFIIRSQSATEIAFGGLYSEQAVASGITTEKADMISASIPYRIMHQFHIPVTDQIREHDKDFYARMEKAGFEMDFGEDGSGASMKYLRRGSGYYIDVGAADLVASGEVRLVKGQVDHLTEDAIVLRDGTALPADLVVYATGYGSMNAWAAQLISQQVADRVGKVWGLGSDTTKDPGPWEGELRNMWKPTQQPALWFQGGNLAQARFYSLHLALQLKARYEGLPTPVYGLAEVHHPR